MQNDSPSAKIANANARSTAFFAHSLAGFMLVSPRLYGAAQDRTQAPKIVYGRAMAEGRAGPKSGSSRRLGRSRQESKGSCVLPPITRPRTKRQYLQLLAPAEVRSST